MPQRDKTGPRGAGPRTGRGMGKCTPKDTSQKDVKNDGSGDDVADNSSVPVTGQPFRRARGGYRRNDL